MAKIKGRFAPLTEELGNDERFIIQSTDLDKLMYILVIYTCHMTHHKAPKDSNFYKKRYGLRSKTGQIAASLRRLADMYPNVSWGEKNLSLLKSATYKNGIVQKDTEEEVKSESEVETNKESESKATDLFLNFSEDQTQKIKTTLSVKIDQDIKSQAFEESFRVFREKVEKYVKKNQVAPESWYEYARKTARQWGDPLPKFEPLPAALNAPPKPVYLITPPEKEPETDFDSYQAYHDFRKNYPQEGLEKSDTFLAAANIFYQTVKSPVLASRIHHALENYKNHLLETPAPPKRLSAWLQEWETWEKTFEEKSCP